MSKKLSNPITMYTYQEIDNRYKKIIINELIREHDRAQKLVSSLLDLKNQILGVANLKSDAKQGENKDETITRLTTFLHTIKEKFTNIGESFTTYSKYCDPEVVEENVEEMDYDNVKSEPQPTQVKMDSIPTEVKAYKLDSNTRSFSGASGEKLSQWLFLIDNAFLAQNIHVDKIRLALISNYVKVSPLNALIRKTNEEKYPSWGGFVKILKEQFEDTNMEFKLRTQLFPLKMEHNNFQKYLARFQELLNQLPNTNPNNNDILYNFIDGLKKEFAYSVRREKCTSLNKAILVCND
jgi:hemerythrin-like domain-containing protein